MKNLLQRSLTGIVYVALLTAAICLHPLLFAGLFGVVVGLLIHEFYALTKCEITAWQRWASIAGGVYLFVASCLYAGNCAGYEIYLPYLTLLLALLISELYTRNPNPVVRWGTMLFAHFYCAGLLSLLTFIPYMRSTDYSPMPVMILFIFIWLNDTGAYLVGSWKGRHHLFQRISPSKSWEGFFGGLATVIVAALILSRFCSSVIDAKWQWYEWIVFAAITVVAATFGDLFESLLKRTYKAKDSGNILPGHGGVLDRFDSAILAAPVVYMYLKLLT